MKFREPCYIPKLARPSQIYNARRIYNVYRRSLNLNKLDTCHSIYDNRQVLISSNAYASTIHKQGYLSLA